MVALALLGRRSPAWLVFARQRDQVTSPRWRPSTPAAIVTNWWIAGTPATGSSWAAIFLVIGGLIGGATVVGGEWRAGTVATVLTWEPSRCGSTSPARRRRRGLAFVIGLALQVVFLARLLPAVVLNGSTDGSRRRLVASLAARSPASGSSPRCRRPSAPRWPRSVGTTAPALAIAVAWLAVVEPLLAAGGPASPAT